MDVAKCVPGTEKINSLLRTEAYRLLARAHASLGECVLVCEALECVAAEASGAKYVWLERLSLRVSCGLPIPHEYTSV